MRGRDLGTAFVQEVRDDGSFASGDRLILAFSGGVDSSVLLHLFRFHPDLSDLEIHAAHFDHAMRPDSREDMLWARGLCRAWQLPFHTERATIPPTSEDEAREKRYEFLLRVKERAGALWVITGHQADDQAETVLFRICRGTGLRGLAGIPRKRPPGLVRPLLPFSRQEILEYARSMKVPFLQDPTNQDLMNPRNQLRHRILPQLQLGPAPKVRQSLLRLARLAHENEAAWESLLPRLLDGVLMEEDGSDFVVRSALLSYHPAVQGRLLREILQGQGIELDEAGTRAAVEFIRTGTSGRSLSLPGRRLLVREFDRLLIRESQEPGADQSLIIPGREAGEGRLTLDGGEFQVQWGPRKLAGFQDAVQIPASSLGFPLTFRGWLPGDRIQLDYGTKKLKKLFSEAKVPLGDRKRVPVLSDAKGEVIWVVGLASSNRLHDPSGQGDIFYLGIRNVDS